jgi:hypothetical protein
VPQAPGRALCRRWCGSACRRDGDAEGRRRRQRAHAAQGRAWQGGRYRNAMVSEDLLSLLRQWWKIGPQQGVKHRDGCLFPKQHAMKPISTWHLYRVVVEAAKAADIAKRVGLHTLRHSFATRLLEDPPTSGSSTSCSGTPSSTTPPFTPRTRPGRFAPSRARSTNLAAAEPCAPQSRSPTSSALPARLPGRPCRTPEPHPAQGHVGDRELPHRGARRSPRSLRGPRPVVHCLQFLPGNPAQPSSDSQTVMDVHQKLRHCAVPNRFGSQVGLAYCSAFMTSIHTNRSLPSTQAS